MAAVGVPGVTAERVAAVKALAAVPADDIDLFTLSNALSERSDA